MSEKNYYFFTNQRNLLQSLVKGYLCNINYWDRKWEDFSTEIDYFTKYLFFSTNLLDFSYAFNKDNI